MKFKEVWKLVQSGQYKNLDKTKKWEAHEAIRRKEAVMEAERAALYPKVFNRFLVNSGRGTKYSEHATEEPITKGRPWMHKIIAGKFSKSTESTARERDRLDTVKRAFGLTAASGTFNSVK